MAGYATSGRGWHNPTVAGLLRRDERVHAQSIELVDCLCRPLHGEEATFPFSVVAGQQLAAQLQDQAGGGPAQPQ